MATGPEFVIAEAFPESHSDALQRVFDRRGRTPRAHGAPHDRPRACPAGAGPSGSIWEPDARQAVLPRRGRRPPRHHREGRREPDRLLGCPRRCLPRTLARFERGTISWQHATVIVDELGRLLKSSRDLVEQIALDHAPSITPNQLGRILRRERELIAPESIPERHEVARERRGVELAG